MTAKNRRYTDDDRRKLVTEVQAAKSVHAGCQQAGIVTSQYYAWKRQFANGAPLNGQPEQPEQSEKRRYKKRTAHSVAVNFCPNCGCNLHRVAMGMVIAQSQ